MSLEKPSFIEAFRMRKGDQLTPFHIRVQLWMLLFGPGSLKQKLWSFLTVSKSPWNLRESLVAFIRKEALALYQALEMSHIFSVKEIQQALQAKLESEGRSDGFHIGLIADGNRRYGVSMGQSKSWGHVQGAQTIRNVFLPLIAQIPQITECSIYLLSDSNVKNRPEKELKALDELFDHEYTRLLALAEQHQLRYEHAGDMEGLEEKMPKMAGKLRELVSQTQHHTGLRVNLCINYQAKTELGYGAKEWAIEQIESGTTREQIMAIPNAEVTENIRKEVWIQKKMDLCIRTGGDSRGSGFPLNHAWNEDCQFAVLSKFLPQVNAQDVLKLLHEFSGADRRMGK